MTCSCPEAMSGETTVDAWTAAGFKARELADRPTDSCSLATTSDGCSPVAVPEVQAAGCQYRRDLLLSFRSLLPTQPAGCALPWLVPTETVWEPWWRTPKRRARRAEPKLPEAPAGDPAEARAPELVQEVLPDLPQPAPEDQDFLAASVRSRGRKPQAAVQVVCSFHTRAWPGARRRREEGDLLESSKGV
mmetsp:Transcript_149246/g.212147  ORF Transcript_149246/g.212147 Transcript_149246/m.212147 type:complete len:190 (+) Transcript_149246:30-599(+)